MTKIALFYGNSMGKTQNIEHLLQEILQSYDIDTFSDYINYARGKYDMLIIGLSAFNSKEIEDDWEDFVANLSEESLLNKSVAILKIGTHLEYAENFLCAMGAIYESIASRGSAVIGSQDIRLNLRKSNSFDLSDDKVIEWIEAVTPYFESDSLVA